MHFAPALSAPADDPWTIHVARQPITNRAGGLEGYELLFRDAPGATFATQRAATATSRVLVNTFAEFGLGRLVGDRLGFVNLTREFLVGEIPLPFAPELAVLEVLETVEVDDAVVAGVAKLAHQGFAIALDDFVWGTSHDRLVDLASYIKLEVNGVDPDELAERVARCRDRRLPGLRLVAERLENEDDHRRAMDLGFDLFQGYLLGRPETLSVAALAPSRLRQLELLGLLTLPDVDLATLTAAVKADPGLALRILRATNSVSAGQQRRISSIRDAVIMLGVERLRQWLAVMVVSDLSQAGEADRTIPMVRGRWCQNLAEQAKLPPDVGFTVGLLSGVADLLGVAPAELSERLPLTEEVTRALVGGEGELGAILTAVRAYEVGHRVGTPTGAAPNLGVLVRTYLEAIDWSTTTTTALR